MLDVIKSDTLSNVRHGFFTRAGGVSEGIYAALNCGQGSSDNPDHVMQNRQLVAAHIGVRTDHLASVHQYHSNVTLTVTEPLSGDKPKADAMVTNVAGMALGVLTADCAPILFADENAGVIGAAHSGWKGAVAGIAASTIDAMTKLGANRADICATVGPCISQASYEVGDDFLDNLIAQDADNTRFFANGINGKYQFDLPSFCLQNLRAEGIKSADWTGHCTYQDPAKFFSYRRTCHQNEPDYGRLISVIRL